jgi:rare lipoprotein A
VSRHFASFTLALPLAVALAVESACTRPTPPAPPSAVVHPAPAPAPPPPPAPVRVVDKDDDDDGVEEGDASMYADLLAGGATASGEPYRVDRSTCAHREYEFDTVLEVTDVATGTKARCRVNDRGPNVDEHLIDVSRKVARALGMKGSSVLDVRVRVADDQSDPDRPRSKSATMAP